MDQAYNDDKIDKIVSLRNFINPNCFEYLEPISCLYLFPLCNKNKKKVGLSFKQCEYAKRNICKTEWEQAESFGIDLPQCDIFPDTHPLKLDCCKFIMISV